MPLLNGIDAARQILRDSLKAKILILTMYTDDRYVRASLRAGVSGFLLKSKAGSFLVEAIRTISCGEVYFCRAIATPVATALLDENHARDDSLSEREREVLRLIGEGKTSKRDRPPPRSYI